MPEREVVHRVLETLGKLPGLRIVRFDESRMGMGLGDGTLVISSGAGSAEYTVEARRSVTTTGLPALLVQLSELRDLAQHPPLLATPHVTPAVAERLMAEGIEFADEAGNVYLNGPAAYAVVMGRTPDRLPTPSSGLTFASLVLLFAFLTRPDLRYSTYREVSRVTGISLGKISKTIRELEAANQIVRLDDQGIAIREFRRLLHRWEVGYLEVVRPKLNPTHWRMPPNVTTHDLVVELESFEGVVVGGEYAADSYTHHLRPASLTVHVPAASIKQLSGTLRLSRAEAGYDVILLERFAPPLDEPRDELVRDVDSKRHEVRLTNPILTRAELLASGDDRLREVADRLLEGVILEDEARASS